MRSSLPSRERGREYAEHEIRSVSARFTQTDDDECNRDITSVGMFEMVPSLVIMAIPVSEIHIIDVGTSLGNDSQLQVAITVGASGQHAQCVRSPAKYDLVSCL